MLLSRWLAAIGSYLSSKAWHYTCTIHTNVRAHRWIHGQKDVQTNYKDQAGALWGTQKKNTDRRKVDDTARVDVGEQTDMEHRKIPREDMSSCVWVHCSSWEPVTSAIETKEKKNLMEQNSCPQHQLPEEILSWGFGFHLLAMEVVLESLRVFIPYDLRLYRGITFKWLHAFLYSSL